VTIRRPPPSYDLMMHAVLWLLVLADVPDRSVTVRLDLPSVARSGEDDYFQVGGVTASVRWGRIEAELGADYWGNACRQGLAFGARAGVAPSLVAKTARWDVRLPLHAGLIFAPLPGDGCEYTPEIHLLAAVAAGGIEVVRWGSAGFAVRLAAFAGPRLFREPTQRDALALYGATLSIGIALPAVE
jgi:hypothetical protein